MLGMAHKTNKKEKDYSVLADWMLRLGYKTVESNQEAVKALVEEIKIRKNAKK